MPIDEQEGLNTSLENEIPAPGLKEITVYTDGACTGNPGPGGYGIVLMHGAKRREISGGFRRTTNNRMELMAVIVALDTLRYRCRVTINTDSSYVSNGIMLGWARRWRSKGWRKSDGKPVINIDLWTRLLDLLEQHEASFVWLRGHAGHAENERCDTLAVEAAKGSDLPVDSGYR
jgi:ribonuclease HI